MASLSYFPVCLFLCSFSQLTLLFNNDAYPAFLKFIEKYNKSYAVNSGEFWYRYDVFRNNLRSLEGLNKFHVNETAVFGVNKFSDITQEEFERKYLNGLVHDKSQPSEKHLNLPKWRLYQSTRPVKVDWRDKGIISAVKNQGSCGACWAFTVTETTESMYAKATKAAVPNLAVQEVIDCATGNYGCEGGDTCTALHWLVKNKKTLVYEKDYPLADKTQKCQLGNKTMKGVRVHNYTCQNFVDSEDSMLDLLSTVGPLSVTIDASTWKNYIGGIIKFHCPNFNNHAVQIVGYDLTGDVPYYIVRNSWGTDFGDNGYLYIKVGKNLCGLASRVSTVQVNV